MHFTLESVSPPSRLQLVQKAAACLLTEVHKREHITPILASFHWLPVHFKILLFVFRSLNGLDLPLHIRQDPSLSISKRYFKNQLLFLRLLWL